MACDEIHVGDEMPFIATIKDGCGDAAGIVDVSAATELKMFFKKPITAGGAVVEKAAQLYTDGKDGKIVYETIASDLSVKGGWKLQGRVRLPSGRWSSDILTFTVYENLDG